MNLFGGLSWSLLSAILAIDLLSSGLAAFKWKLLLPQVSFGRVLSVSLLGRFYSFVLPGQIVGESLKAYYLGRKEKNLELVATSIVFDKLTGIAGLLITGSVGVLFSQRQVPLAVPGVFVSLMVFVVLIFFSFNASFFQQGMKRLGWQVSAGSFRAYASDKKLLMGQIVLGILYQMTGVWIGWLFGMAFGIPLAVADYCWVFAAVFLALILPVTIAGLGIREGAFIGLLGWLGTEREKALALSLAFFGVQVVDAALGGIFLLKETCQRSLKRR